jgi:hypothetical protein
MPEKIAVPGRYPCANPRVRHRDKIIRKLEIIGELSRYVVCNLWVYYERISVPLPPCRRDMSRPPLQSGTYISFM